MSLYILFYMRARAALEDFMIVLMILMICQIVYECFNGIAACADMPVGL